MLLNQVIDHRAVVLGSMIYNYKFIIYIYNYIYNYTL